MDYSKKIILAPMVRVGKLPMRLLSLDYGADLVYSEELIDFKLLQCKRVENVVLGTVDFIWNDGSVIFRTCPQERGKVILQMGTSDAQRAEKVARMVEKDVAGIDVNMGCPKEFSVKGGMGAALLKQPGKAKEIMTALVNAVSIPVTCKIRILDTLDETLSLVKLLVATGISALGVHGRMKDERPRHPNHNDIIKIIAQSTNIPIIANGGSGEVRAHEDIAKFRDDSGAASVMLARAAMYNPSIFRQQGLLNIETVINSYLKYAIDYDNHAINVKYCLQQMIRDQLDTPRGRSLQSAATVREICSLWNMQDYCDRAVARRLRKEEDIRKQQGQHSVFKKRKLEDGSEITEMPWKYNRKSYDDKNSPKMVLYTWTRQNNYPNPDYMTTEDKAERMFLTVLQVNGKKYASTIWDKSKKNAEQASAVVCLLSMGMSDGRREFVAPHSEDSTSISHRDAPDSTQLGEPASQCDHNNHCDLDNYKKCTFSAVEHPSDSACECGGKHISTNLSCCAANEQLQETDSSESHNCKMLSHRNTSIDGKLKNAAGVARDTR